MKIQRPLCWHQGLFLQPQHFQLQDQSVLSRLIPFLRYQGPHFWGVGAAEIDEPALANGTFSLDSASFLFADGTYVEFPGNALLTPRRFELQEGKPLQVLVGLKKWNDAGENVTVVEKREEIFSASTRFISMADPDQVRDLHCGGPDADVKELQYLVSIFWESELEQLGEYLLIPLAHVEDFGGVQLSKKFIPPALVIESSEPLLKLVREIRDQLSARTRQLEQYKKQRGVQTAEFGSRDMIYLFALRTLNRHLPQIFHFTEAGIVHPWEVYGTLTSLIGELSSFSLRLNAAGESADGERLLPAYDHKRLWECFAAARDLVLQLLDEITAGPHYIVNLANDGLYFTADLKASALEAGNRFFLSLQTEEDPQTLLKCLDSVAKVSSRGHLPVLTSHALPGVEIEHLHLPPQELPRRANTHYFSLNHHHPQWEMVEKEQNIALHLPDAPADLQANLMILERIQ
jgi:type VI secretion system protein ImpJ